MLIASLFSMPLARANKLKPSPAFGLSHCLQIQVPCPSLSSNVKRSVPPQIGQGSPFSLPLAPTVILLSSNKDTQFPWVCFF